MTAMPPWPEVSLPVGSPKQADGRHDFGASLHVQRCAECQKVVWNRGCAACERRLCAAHFAGHRCACKREPSSGGSGSTAEGSFAAPALALAAPRAPLVDARQLAEDRGLLSVAARCVSREGAFEEDIAIEARILGTGVSGAVRQGRRRASGRRCAVKSFDKTRLREAELDALGNEASIFLSVDHPHIARLEHVYETDDSLHLVMEHLEGGEIYDHLAQVRRFEERATIDTLKQTLSAVAYLHSQQLGHFDLKIENFVYERADRRHLKLIDFGFAARLAPGRRLKRACGSLHSVAPEVLAKDYDEKADVWSMGVLTYILLTGASPWKGTDSQIMDGIRECRPDYSRPHFSSLSAGAKDFVRSLLARRPESRPSAQWALAHPWLSGGVAGGVAPERPMPSGSAQAALLQRLREYSEATPRQRAIKYLLAWSLPLEQLREARSQFLELSGRAGSISQEALSGLARSAGFAEDAEPLFRSLVINGSGGGEVSFAEFLAAAVAGPEAMDAASLSAEEEAALAEAMRRFDAEGDSQQPVGSIGEEGCCEQLAEDDGEERALHGLDKASCCEPPDDFHSDAFKTPPPFEDDTASTVADFTSEFDGQSNTSTSRSGTKDSMRGEGERREFGAVGSVTPSDKGCCQRRRQAPGSAPSDGWGPLLEPLLTILGAM